MSGGAIAAVASLCVVAGFLFDRFVSPGRRELREHRRRQDDVSALLEMLPFFRKFREDWEGEPEQRTADGAVVLEPRQPGVIEQMRVHGEAIQEIRQQVNGSGLGGQLTGIAAKVDEHVAEAAESRQQVMEEQREIREFVADAARVLTENQQRIEDRVDIVDGKVDALDHKVTARLFALEEVERTHRAVLSEIGHDVDIPVPPDRGRPALPAD